MGLGLALTVGAAGVAAAQATRPENPRPNAERRARAEQGERGARRRGGPDRALLKNITLTDAQKARLETLRKERQPEMQKSREQLGAVMKEAREARQKGDTVTARAKMEQVRAQMTQQREQHIASLRGILTADQQKQFDANVAEWKERGERGMKAGRQGRRGGQPRTSGAGTGR
jgi:Spy/CpxP family protein refolding chaperone